MSLNTFKVLVGTIYLSPSTTLPVIESYTSSVKQLISLFYPCSVLLCGDFNFSHVNWSIDRLGLIFSGSLTATSIHLTDSFSYFNFFQLNNLRNNHGSTLDLVFSNSNVLCVSKAALSFVGPDYYHPLCTLSVQFIQKSNIAIRILSVISNFVIII